MNEEMKMLLTSLNSFFLLLVDFILRKIGFLIKLVGQVEKWLPRINRIQNQFI